MTRLRINSVELRSIKLKKVTSRYKTLENDIELETLLENKYDTSADDSTDYTESRQESVAITPPESKQDTEEHIAPDGGWGWFIVLGCLLLRIIIGGLGRSDGLFFIEFQERFGGSATFTALITSLCGFVRLAVGPVVSILCSRFSVRLLTFIGAGLLSIGLISTGYSPNQQFLYCSYGVVSGLGRVVALTPCPIILGYYFNKRRSLAFGLASAGFSIGGFSITPIVGLLFQNFGFEGTFLILSAFTLNICVSAALFRSIEQHRKLTTGRRKSVINEDNISPQVNTTKKKKLISWSILKDTRFLCFAVATFCFTLPRNALFLPSLAMAKGTSELQAATLLSAGAGFDTAFRVISGIVLDFKMVRPIRLQIYTLVTFLQAIVTLLFPFMSSFPAFMTLCALEGVLLGINSAQDDVLMVDMLGAEKLSSSMAVTMIVKGLAVVIGPAIAGLLKDIYGTYDGVFYFAAGSILLGSFVMAVGNIWTHFKGKRKDNSKQVYSDL